MMQTFVLPTEQHVIYNHHPETQTPRQHPTLKRTESAPSLEYTSQTSITSLTNLLENTADALLASIDCPNPLVNSTNSNSSNSNSEEEGGDSTQESISSNASDDEEHTVTSSSTCAGCLTSSKCQYRHLRHLHRKRLCASAEFHPMSGDNKEGKRSIIKWL